MDDNEYAWHSPRMHRQGTIRYFLVILILAQALAVHGLVTAWSRAASAGSLSAGLDAIYCIANHDDALPDGKGTSGQPAHHDCAAACATLTGAVPGPAGVSQPAPVLAHVAVLQTARAVLGPAMMLGAVQARGPPERT
jgi:hypothetical protein